jgi:hypothetical protein
MFFLCWIHGWRGDYGVLQELEAIDEALSLTEQGERWSGPS